MDRVRIGIVGLGNMGTLTAGFLYAGEIADCEIGAVCDIREERLAYARAHFDRLPEHCLYRDFHRMLDEAAIDAVYIAVPHPLHPVVATEAFRRGLHVLTEKPEAVCTADAHAMNTSYAAACVAHPRLCYAIMYNQRTNPYYRWIREAVRTCELGPLRRAVWNITNWYRTQAYFDSSDWRATWNGEGAGVLINQSIHNLDLWQWMLGMPGRIRAFAYEGKYHDIQVEDDVTIYAEYPDGATGIFLTSTGEYPGENRLVLQFDAGKIIYDGGALRVWRLSEGARGFSDRTEQPFGAPDSLYEEIRLPDPETAHRGILRNFTQSILTGEALLAPGTEGIYALSLCNAALLSAWKDDWILFQEGENPLRPYEKEYRSLLDSKILAASGCVKRGGPAKFLDLAANASGGSLGLHG